MLAGSGNASVSTRSNSSWPATASRSRAVVASMAGIIAVTRFMLNARAAGLRSLAYRRGVRRGVAEYLGYGVVAGDDVVADRRGEEHRLAAAGQRGHDRVG